MPRQLGIGMVVVAVLIVGASAFGILGVPLLSPEVQTFWSGLIGSFVGSAAAFGGAAWLWRMERHILVTERKGDRDDSMLAEKQRADKAMLRDCLSIAGHLRALKYNTLNEAPYATARDAFLLSLKFSQAVSQVQDDELRGELTLIAQLIEEDSIVDDTIAPLALRLDIVRDWLLRLISLDVDAGPIKARPANHSNLIAGIKDAEEIYAEQRSEP